MDSLGNINWADVITGLAGCISFSSGLSIEGQCIQDKILPPIAKAVVADMDTISISGTNPLPLNRSWAKANSGALVLIIIMAILCAALIAAIVVCLCCCDAADSSSEDKETEDDSSVCSNPLTASENGNDASVSRYSSRYSAAQSQKSPLEDDNSVAEVGVVEAPPETQQYSRGPSAPKGVTTQKQQPSQLSTSRSAPGMQQQQQHRRVASQRPSQGQQPQHANARAVPYQYPQQPAYVYPRQPAYGYPSQQQQQQALPLPQPKQPYLSTAPPAYNASSSAPLSSQSVTDDISVFGDIEY